MAATDWFSRVYARQEYLTPGAPETVELLAASAHLSASSRLLEIAFGKAEAACTIASRFNSRVIAVDRYPPFLGYASEKVRTRGLVDHVSLVRADGRRSPVRSGVFDAAYCIGAPSIVGLEPCLDELARAVRPGGVVAVSDITWRNQPDAPLGPEWSWVANMTPRLSADEYAALLTARGLTVETVHLHPRAAWDAYHGPMEIVAGEARAEGDTAFADRVIEGVVLERRALDAFFEYTSIIARKPAASPACA
ncbi:MAG: class I SAM-dependent methyltransferase [Chloroflexi bacterium]|nr:class I SAM-dependent methyltransferase [Chloroflexota bacterium]